MWLILAGRGWGKTRTGSEYIRYRVERCGAKRIGIIAQTTADVRDVLVEGESGILAVSPPWNRPIYEPTKRRLTWPNGAIATTYSGDSPDQLRGPQHDTVLADEICLIVGTQIMTATGSIAIEDVQSGDLVWTRAGLRRVRRAWQSSPAASVYELLTSDGRTLIGTANHPIWTEENGFLPLHSVPYGSILSVWDKTKQSSQASCGADADGFLMVDTTAIAKGSCSTAQSIAPRMARSPLASKSITKMKTSSIMSFPILKDLRALSTGGNTAGDTSNGTKSSEAPRSVSNGPIVSRMRYFVQSAASRLSQLARVRSIAQISVALLTIASKSATPPNARVRTAGIPSWLGRLALRSIAARHVSAQGKRQEETHDPRCNQRHVSFAARSSSPAIPAPAHAHAPADTASSPCVRAVKPLSARYPVYNLDIEDCPEYYANGILTHNCKWRYPTECWDNMEMGLRLGSDPRAVVTTTPRPIPLILALRDDPQTVRPTTNLSTHINRANVSERFVRRVIGKYSGTRLGRQELDAEILEDTPGALWSRSGIEQTRIHPRDLPELIRIVIGVDPSAGGVDGETGIIGAGKDANEHGYLLGDYTESGDPAVWAPAVIRAYIELRADAIVVETNNGGKMIAHVIRQTSVEIGGVLIMGRNLPIIEVWASRGKHTRAEPISMLWSQGRGHYVGAFPELEDQCCTWVPGEDSPDRMDAKVWAMTELFPNEESTGPDFAPTVGGSRAVVATSLRGRR